MNAPNIRQKSRAAINFQRRTGVRVCVAETKGLAVAHAAARSGLMTVPQHISDRVWDLFNSWFENGLGH